jgi:hypothetical protein
VAGGEYGSYRLDSPEVRSHLRSAAELLRVATTGDEDVLDQWVAAYGTVKLRDLVSPEALPAVRRRLTEAVSAGADPADWPARARLADEVASVVCTAASRALTLTAMAHVLIANRLLIALADATDRPVAELLDEIDAWTVEEFRDKQPGDKP